MEQLRAPEFYPNEVSRLSGVDGNAEKTLRSIDNTLKRIEAILLDFKKEKCCPPLDALREAFADSILKMKTEGRRKEVSNQMIEEQIEHKDSVISDVDSVIKAVSQKIINSYFSIEMEPSTIEALASLVTARTSMKYNSFSNIDTV